MFDHSIAVLANISRNIKKYLNITNIVTQLLFMSYYAYLIVINVSNTQFLIAYSLIEGFALLILLVDIITTLNELDRKAKKIKARTKRIINYFSWAVKLLVIIYNIILIVRGETSEAGKIFLIFSAFFLVIQILLTIISSLTSYYLDLILYGLKMDYEMIVDTETAKRRPVGKLLNNATKDLDYKDHINEYSIQYEVRGAIKKELMKELPLKINNKVVKKKKAERIILHYYRKANKYYLSHEKLKGLLDKLKDEHITYLTSDDHLYVLLFFANNHLKNNYVGLSEYALKLIIATLIFVIDGNDRSVVDLTFKAISKELLNVSTWNKVIKAPKDDSEYEHVLEIVKNTKELNKKNREATIMSELEDITIEQVTNKIDPPKPIKKIVEHMIRKKHKK